jgi:hypothetical protein
LYGYILDIHEEFFIQKIEERKKDAKNIKSLENNQIIS